MKITFQYLLTLLLTFSFITITYSQVQDHYHSASINVSVPVTVNWQKKIHKKDQDGKIVNTITKDDPQKPIYIQINLRIEDLNVNGNSFRGKQITNYPVYDEIKSFYGQVSANKKMIEFIEVTYNLTKYSIADRSKGYLEETVNSKVRFEDVPLKLGGYSYKYGATKITDVSYDKMRHVEYRGQNETVEENFVSVDEGNITKWSTCIRANFTPGKLKIDKDYNDKLTVILDDMNDSVHIYKRGTAALLIAKFSKVPGLRLLERIHYDKIKQEMDLSKSGLVLPETKVESDKVLDPDIEVIIKTDEINIAENSITVRTIIKDISTGKIADPGLVFKIEPAADLLNRWYAYADEVVEFTKKHFLF